MREVVTSLVPCGSCTACCHGEAVYLYPEAGDDPSRFETTTGFNPLEGRIQPLLKKKSNGDCIHLEAGACAVYDHRPATCRSFDCRKFVRGLTDKARHSLSNTPQFGPLIRRGRQLIAQEPSG